MDYEVPIIMDCGCRILRYESCWGPTGVKRVEYCERHCPVCKYQKPLPVDATDLEKDMVRHNPKWHGEDGER